MKKEIKRTEFGNLNDSQKVNYVKNLLFNNDLSAVVDELLKYEKKDLKIIRIIDKALDDDKIAKRIKEQQNLNGIDAKTYTYSKIISVLAFFNKQVILSNFFKSLKEEDLRNIARYEYQNKTNTSVSNDIFKKYCGKYEEEVKEMERLQQENVLMLTMEYNAFKNISRKKETRKKNRIILASIGVVLLLLFGYLIYDSYKLIDSYKGKIYPGIYLNDADLSGLRISELDNKIKLQQDKIEQGKIVVDNVNGNKEYTYKDIGIEVKSTDVSKKIKDYNKNLSSIRKYIMIKSNKRYKTFYLDASFNDETINNFIVSLKEKLDTQPENDSLIIDEEHNVSYTKGKKGFKLDEEKTKKELMDKLLMLGEKITINTYGNVIENEVNNAKLSTIDTKVSSFTTYFANTGNRGHNIVLASSKLNDTVVMPGETFSYLKTVGPYNGASGYRPAPVYVSGILSTANGGGVCQLATTLYNAQLRAGLEIVYRTNHTYAPAYVPMGLDATVSGTWPDYQFKNQYEYPFYIVSYVKGNYLTVDIWTNKNALDGKTFEPYTIYSNGGYSAYLRILKDGQVIENKYLNRSVYKSH